MINIVELKSISTKKSCKLLDELRLAHAKILDAQLIIEKLESKYNVNLLTHINENLDTQMSHLGSILQLMTHVEECEELIK